MMTHKEMTKHIRTLFKRAHIKARVQSASAFGYDIIKIVTPGYYRFFSAHEIEQFTTWALENSLVSPDLTKVNPKLERQLTRKREWTFYYCP